MAIAIPAAPVAPAVPVATLRPAVRRARFVVTATSRDVAEAIRAALDGAARRLAEPACDALLTEFSDRSGRPLRARLAELQTSAPDYLDSIAFHDGSERGRCRPEHVLAFTSPGSRDVYVCGGRFAHMRWRDPFYAEALMIHEALHTLGLGEDPPTSRDITARVLRRCRR